MKVIRNSSDRAENQLTSGVSPPERSVGHAAVDALSPVLGLGRLLGRLREGVGEALAEVGGHGQGGRGAGAGGG